MLAPKNILSQNNATQGPIPLKPENIEFYNHV